MAKAFFKNPCREFIVDLLYDIIGCLIFSVGVQSFSAPFNLPPGGVTGVAMMAEHITGLPLALGSLFINIPILIIGFFILGRKFTMKSMKTVIVLTFALQFAEVFVPQYTDDVMLAALFGGVLQGFGLALVLMRGSTTGGVDIISRILQLKFPHLSIGRIILIIDALVLSATAIVYQSLGNAMYSLILVFVSSKVIDGVIFGLDSGRMMMIISDNYTEIAGAISDELERGSTLLDGMGTYTNMERKVLICAISNREFHNVKKIVYTVDPNAFIMSLQTDEVLGEGFKPLKPHK